MKVNLKLAVFVFMSMLIIGAVYAATTTTWTPPADINGKNFYQIINVSNITAIRYTLIDGTPLVNKTYADNTYVNSSGTVSHSLTSDLATDSVSATSATQLNDGTITFNNDGNGNWQIDAGGINLPNYINAAGSPVQGTLGFNFTSNTPMFFNGSVWFSFNSTDPRFNYNQTVTIVSGSPGNLTVNSTGINTQITLNMTSIQNWLNTLYMTISNTNSAVLGNRTLIESEISGNRTILQTAMTGNLSQAQNFTVNAIVRINASTVNATNFTTFQGGGYCLVSDCSHRIYYNGTATVIA
mgnify:CR=1 FL=1